MVDYITFHDAIKQNGDRHLANANNYLREGKVDYAIGSLRKAIRNYEKYVEFISLFRLSLPETIIVNRLRMQMESLILYGNPDLDNDPPRD